MALSLQNRALISIEARRQAQAAQRSAMAFREALPFGALIGVYLRERRAHAAMLTRFGSGRWYVESQPEASPVLVRKLLTYGPQSKQTAFLAKTDLRAWLRGRDVRIETLIAALRELKVLVGPPAGHRISMASRTRVCGVPVMAIEVDLKRLAFLAKKGDVPRLGAAWGDGARR